MLSSEPAVRHWNKTPLRFQKKSDTPSIHGFTKQQNSATTKASVS